VEITKNITKNNIITGKFILLSLVLFLFYNCTIPTHTSVKHHKNLAYLYNDSEAYLHPKYQVYNFTNDSSIVYFKIPTEDLLVRDLGDKYDKYAVVELNYRLYESLSIASLIDSATITQKIIIDKSNKNNLYSFKIKTPYLIKSYLRIQIKDLYSERKRQDYIEIDKMSSVNRQNFLILSKSDKTPLFGNQILVGSYYLVESELQKNNRLYVETQAIIKTIPNLPFSTQRTSSVKFKSDSTYLLKNGILKTEQANLLFLTFDTTKIKGVALYAYDSTENYLHTPRQMIEPLSYLLSPKEYQLLLQDSNPKFALDKFWLKMGENTRHAKEMIKVYYHRVSVSNKYFSSYRLGWRTDRGMVYVIYGEPTVIYKSETLERWIYGNEESGQSILFDFKKEKNPFTDNDFELLREEEYQKTWFQAIDSWRNGRIYSIAK